MCVWCVAGGGAIRLRKNNVVRKKHVPKGIYKQGEEGTGGWWVAVGHQFQQAVGVGQELLQLMYGTVVATRRLIDTRMDGWKVCEGWYREKVGGTYGKGVGVTIRSPTCSLAITAIQLRSTYLGLAMCCSLTRSALGRLSDNRRAW